MATAINMSKKAWIEWANAPAYTLKQRRQIESCFSAEHMSTRPRLTPSSSVLVRWSLQRRLSIPGAMVPTQDLRPKERATQWSPTQSDYPISSYSNILHTESCIYSNTVYLNIAFIEQKAVIVFFRSDVVLALWLSVGLKWLGNTPHTEIFF